MIVRKCIVAIVCLVCRSYLPYLILGVWNRCTGTFRSVFLCYPAAGRYGSHYASPRLERLYKWVPVPIGIFQQGRHWGIVFGTAVEEAEFLKTTNHAQAIALFRRMQRIARMLGTEKTSYAGILPSLIEKHFPEFAGQPDTTPETVAAAYFSVVSQMGAEPSACEVILLGGNGYVGRRLQQVLAKKDIRLHVVDIAGGAACLPEHLRGRKAVLIDLSRRGVLDIYVDQMWPGLIVLNETFPEPDRRVVRKLKSRGVEVLHLAGVAGKVVPPLPFAYRGAVPCCAIHDQGVQRLVIRAL